MSRLRRIIVLNVTGLVAGVISLHFGNIEISNLADPASKATIVAALLTLFGIIFSAVYSEIASYYKDASMNAEKKWQLIFPRLEKHYMPMINSANSLKNALRNYDVQKKSYDAAVHVLYLTTVFYGCRLRFLRESGGFILLSTTEDQLQVAKAYTEVVRSFGFAGEKTSSQVSKLQRFFVTKDKLDDPYVQDRFIADLKLDKEDPKIEDMVKELQIWLDVETKTRLADTLDKFADSFSEKIDKLYSAWQT